MHIFANPIQILSKRDVVLRPAALIAAVLLSGCASSPLVEGSTLSSYADLTQSDGKLTKSRLRVQKEQVLAAKTVNIRPAQFGANAAPDLNDQQRELVANALSRALCVNLSDRFEVVAPEEPADLTVRVAVTQATPTNEAAAGLSVAASLGASFIETPVPIPVPRIPLGLGNLSVEAEAIDRAGKQQAAMVWGRGANILFSSPKMSKASDAYDLADAFGDDFANLLNRGDTPFKFHGLPIPSWQKVTSGAGFAPKYAACETYGRAPGVVGFVGKKVGLPPEWTDSGAKTEKSE